VRKPAYIVAFASALMITIGALAGTNNLATESARVIERAHVNKFQTALAGDVVPRDSAGTVTDIAASLGSATYRWLNLVGKKLTLTTDAGGKSVTLVAPSPLPSNVPITMPSGLPGSGSKVLSLSSTGVMTYGTSSTIVAADISTDAVTTAKILNSNVTTAKIADLNVTDAKRAPLNYAISSVNSATLEDYTSTTWTGVTNLSATITTVGRPVLVILQPVEGVGAGAGSIMCSKGGATGQCEYRFTLDGTADANQITYWMDGDTAGTGEKHFGHVYFDASVLGSATSHTWRLQVKLTNSGGGTGHIYIINMKMLAYEL
jgi:hypothetical protein